MRSLGNYCSGVWCFINVILLTAASHEIDVCRPSSCNDHKDVDTFTDLCHQHKGEVSGRCCIRQNSVTSEDKQQIVGIDLRSCDGHTLDALESTQSIASDSPGHIKSHIEILMLDGDILKTCNDALFEGMTQLNFLSLPAKCGCPGGTDAWESSEIQHSIETCRNKTDICVTQNVTCPKHSHCIVHSPGVTWCVCNKGHYGYKCLSRVSLNLSFF
ncbi:hypothetical protein NP493_203g00022 [Ridgeia piscesae]|uniref:EGF-like domain-containing protein n=1 Tax=Ridgeia piscesae TaxID=27915 RepID=A0AAD9UEI1_RIDPI|nr:hypothetical protein NP493_203g00022 [Ridgeia piscesae]